HLPLYASQFVNNLDHMHWDTNGSSLIRHGAGDGLTNPPGSVGREFVALGVVEFLDCTDQPEVTFLNQVQEQHATAGITFGQRNNQTKVCFQQVVFCTAAISDDQLHVTAKSRVRHVFCLHFVLGIQASFNAGCKIDFFFRVQQRNFTDLLQIVFDRVGSCTDDVDCALLRSTFFCFCDNATTGSDGGCNV